MKHLIKTFVISAVLALSASAASAQVSFGIQIGPPPPPRVYRVPPQPAPEFVWVEGYWYPQGNHYAWHDGYWTRPPYAGAYWVAPYHAGNQYYAGRWEGNHGYVVHNHKWDKSHDRDEHHKGREGDRR
jgi:hypothetical protein